MGDPQANADLLDGADVVVRDGTPDEPAQPLALPDSVVECVVTDFPHNGPYARWQADEMVHQALSGYMNATGRAARRPLYGVGHRAYYACGTTAFISVLAALHERRRSGRGQRVRATVFESMAAIGQNFVTQYNYNGTTESRARYTGLLATLKCSDGYIVMFAMRDSAAVCQAGILELLERLAQDTNLATLLITHDLGVAAGQCRRVVAMYAGQVVEDRRTQDFITAPAHPYCQGLMRCVPDPSVLGTIRPGIPGSPPAPGSVPHGCRFRERCDLAEAGCETDQPLLAITARGRLGTVRCWRAEELPGAAAPSTKAEASA
ncbi:oligopeptide/dipeptide ABC transporter ATP-binding protein [Pseudonocardia sp. MH-G8]|uniref:oligopeptide/dipeptide ABC transporter ATP-binding protein n=1 Tax=Pseudonocardia sp. MH-G8 TaxID=1854588 RepID=UPI000BA0F68D|nr:oligopeptide/dipeptide ABC transporter ATP-binding protein [Pseudonocardia sp. MH-G8]OZM76866.1 hypothetical protein CFP66_38710 [Pseudonocardia sp. MH-G8]